MDIHPTGILHRRLSPVDTLIFPCDDYGDFRRRSTVNATTHHRTH